MLENLKKYWFLYTVFLALCSGGVWIYTQGQTDAKDESRMFSTEEMRYETEKYMEQRPSAAQEMRALILDSVEKHHRMQSRARRDSLFQIEVQNRQRTDSILLLNADQMYQIKEELKELKKQRDQ